MTSNRKRATSWRAALALAAGMAGMGMGLVAGSATAADDPSIQGNRRRDIQTAMNEFVDHQTVGGVMRIYDPVEGKLLELKFEELHKGIVKKGDFYVSCADFVDQDGRAIDVDFLVLRDGHALRATQGVVHSVAGVKRKYHLEK